jgi:hypothetical protein
LIGVLEIVDTPLILPSPLNKRAFRYLLWSVHVAFTRRSPWHHLHVNFDI